MTIQQQVTAADQFMELWKILMPDLRAPDRQQFLIWSGTYTDEEVLRGINRAGSKVRKLRGTASPMTANDAERYAASVMRNESLGVQRHERISDYVPFLTETRS